MFQYTVINIYKNKNFVFVNLGQIVAKFIRLLKHGLFYVLVCLI